MADGFLSTDNQATPSGGRGLARGKQSTAAFVPLRAVRIPPSPDRLPGDRAPLDTAAIGHMESVAAESQSHID